MASDPMNVSPLTISPATTCRPEAPVDEEPLYGPPQTLYAADVGEDRSACADGRIRQAVMIGAAKGLEKYAAGQLPAPAQKSVLQNAQILRAHANREDRESATCQLAPELRSSYEAIGEKMASEQMRR